MDQKIVKRPDYSKLVGEDRHFLSELIEEDSPYVFMNQTEYKECSARTNEFHLGSELKLNFYSAY